MYDIEFLEAWNIAAFQFCHGSLAAGHAWVLAATWLAELPVYLAAILVLGWLVRRRDAAAACLVACACASARLAELAMSLLAYHARPFAAGFGPAMVAHAANNSMPSSHATFVWTLAAALAARRQWPLAATLGILGLLVAWARVFVGIHWPLDMVGAALAATLGAFCGCLALRTWAALAQRA
ncbi:phosphatase PAP2 family protein [Bordetella petrii]|uniref:phosphatase PAP2 family protein n=1 Tax=Bordetella petrii TaxID=94624 RepID=UPI003731B985